MSVPPRDAEDDDRPDGEDLAPDGRLGWLLEDSKNAQFHTLFIAALRHKDEHSVLLEQLMQLVADGELPPIHALVVAAISGQPVPQGLALATYLCLLEYETGKYRDLAEALGVFAPPGERSTAGAGARRERLHEVVRHWHLQGHSLRNPSLYDDTAFHRAAGDLDLAPSTVFDIYRGKRR